VSAFYADEKLNDGIPPQIDRKHDDFGTVVDKIVDDNCCIKDLGPSADSNSSNEAKMIDSIAKATLMMPSEMELENRERMEMTGDAHLNPEVNSMMSKSSSEMTPEVVPEVANTDESDECFIMIDRVRSATIKVSIRVNEQSESAVLDTGAEVTVLNSNIYYNIPQQHRPSLKPAKRNLVVAEAGKKMATHGLRL
jgi:hypothetical protein